MPPISAVVHTHNDELRIGRLLQTLHPCDEILIVDHGSTDLTLRIAREYTARVIPIEKSPAVQLGHARNEWLLCLRPNESVSEGLEATLFEWRQRPAADVQSISAGAIVPRIETSSGWTQDPPETRLVPNTWSRWRGQLPAHDPQAIVLEGDLLRFALP